MSIVARGGRLDVVHLNLYSVLEAQSCQYHAFCGWA